jgi:hypothetical protein
VLPVWPENEAAWRLFARCHTRWRYSPGSFMGGVPQRLGLRWVEVYPLLDRLHHKRDDWLDLVGQLEVMEAAVLNPDYQPFSEEGEPA